MNRILFIIITIGLFFFNSHPFAWAEESTSDKKILIDSFERTVKEEPTVATRKIISESDIPFTIPYIQTNDDITASVKLSDDQTSLIKEVSFILKKNDQVIEHRTVTSPYKTVFKDLEKGEYTLDAYALDPEGKVLTDEKFHDHVSRIGIGDIIIAIGDSITEGHYLYKSQMPNWRSAPAEYLSADHRTYPQTAGKAKFPTQTWLPELSNQVTELYGYPVFIKNAGYSEFTTEDYLALMKTKEWQTRQHELAPNKWIILLGVNEGLFTVSAEAYRSNLEQIISLLQNDYRAEAKNIFLAKPSYTVGKDHTKQMLPVVDGFWEKGEVSKGPDFWDYFSSRHETYYKDYVHPNAQGMKEMARLWNLSFVKEVSLPKKVSFYGENLFEFIQKKTKSIVDGHITQ